MLSVSEQASLLCEEFNTKERTLLLDQELDRLKLRNFVQKNPYASLYECTNAYIQRMNDIWHTFPSTYHNVPDLLRSRILSGVRDLAEFERVIWDPPDTLQGLYRRLAWAASNAKTRPHRKLSSHLIAKTEQGQNTEAQSKIQANIVGRMKQYPEEDTRTHSPYQQRRSQSPGWNRQNNWRPRYDN